MSKKVAIGIVSSFDALCGNATYSEELVRGIGEFCDVKKISLNYSLQKNYDKKHVDALCSEIASCDAVNIQMELGLYGPTPNISVKVLSRLIAAAKKVSVTMHRVDMPPPNLLRSLYNAYKNWGIRAMREVFFEYLVKKKVFDAYKRVLVATQKKGGMVICHTVREAEERIKKITPTLKTVVHPILWPNYSHIVPMDIRGNFSNPELPILGIFGFISEYKNYQIVGQGLMRENINVLMAGGTHPASSQYGKPTSNKFPSYIRKISNIFSERAYKGRVFCITAPADDVLISLIKSVDIVCLPYAETGQSGSGIASLAVQHGKKVIMSDTNCTSQLIRFLNTSPYLFDVDSPISFIGAVKLALASPNKIAFSDYTFATLVEAYCHTLGVSTNDDIAVKLI